MGDPRLPALDSRSSNPYKGLRSFEEADAAAFFGREALTQELVGRIAASRFLCVVGPSGSGKSSVVRAGLIPRLRAGAVPGSERWLIAEMVPGAHPFVELEGALLRLGVGGSSALLDILRADELGVLRATKQLLAPGVELVLLIDQLEEVFTLVADEQERTLFLAGIAELARDPHAPVRVVATLRADFYDRPLLYPGFADLMRSYIEPVIPLDPDELERAIAGPARRSGVDLEPGLLAEMLLETSDQPGGLPLLQYALTELFERREGSTLTLGAYRAIGGVSGALAGRAEELYGVSNEEAREATRQLFLRILTLGEGNRGRPSTRDAGRDRVHRCRPASDGRRPGSVRCVASAVIRPGRPYA